MLSTLRVSVRRCLAAASTRLPRRRHRRTHMTYAPSTASAGKTEGARVQRMLADSHAALAPVRAHLLNHRVYDMVDTRAAVQAFMQTHAFAVWDFMTLVKALQQHFAPCAVPWVPPRNTTAARLINEIVLGEETDGFPGLHQHTGHAFMSHTDLYLAAMQQIGADTQWIELTIDNARGGRPPFADVDWEHETAPHRHVQTFVEHTLAQCGPRVPVWSTASSFLFAREDAIPPMFERFLKSLPAEEPVAAMRLYVERHIEVDGGTEEHDGHGEMAAAVLAEVAGTHADRWREVVAAADKAIRLRCLLWDGAADKIERAKTADNTLC